MNDVTESNTSDDLSLMSPSTPDEFKNIIRHFELRVRARRSANCFLKDDNNSFDKAIDQLVLDYKQARWNVGTLLNEHHEVCIIRSS